MAIRPRMGSLAMGTPEERPAWLRPTPGEHRWWISVAMLGLIGLHLALPAAFTPGPKWLAAGIMLGGVVGFVAIHPRRMAGRSSVVRGLAQILFGGFAVWNIVSLSLLIHVITTGEKISANQLLVGGFAVWTANIVLFSLWFWEYDRGGPASRANADVDVPDFLFPQMTDDHLARDWEPLYIDYLYVSFTNSIAFSPTDTMPLSRWSKVLFAVQALASLATIALVAARAVNILPGGN